MDYQLTIAGRVEPAGAVQVALTVVVPVTSLCPCSKGISDYGAHNQRSHVTVHAVVQGDLLLDDLIRLIEAQASCELWGLLKRSDEKFVTERAYDNPKFVEDLVRDVASALKAQPEIGQFWVEAENFESIHNHSAWARITSAGSTGL
jgi:GTP cyclohydrolase I